MHLFLTLFAIYKNQYSYSHVLEHFYRHNYHIHSCTTSILRQFLSNDWHHMCPKWASHFGRLQETTQTLAKKKSTMTRFFEYTVIFGYCQRLAWLEVRDTQVVTIGLRQQPSLNRGTQHIGITWGRLRVGELKRYSGSCKARRIDQIKAASPTLFKASIYTWRCGYTVRFVQEAESSYCPVGTRGTLGTTRER